MRMDFTFLANQRELSRQLKLPMNLIIQNENLRKKVVPVRIYGEYEIDDDTDSDYEDVDEFDNNIKGLHSPSVLNCKSNIKQMKGKKGLEYKFSEIHLIDQP
jgi:hypothetical protein